MEPYNEFHDPLTMNITRQTRVLLSTIHSSSPYAATILNASTQRDLLANISRLLAKPALTLSIAIAFRPLLLPLCAQWLHDEGDEEEKLVALCLLTQPHEELFPFFFFLVRLRLQVIHISSWVQRSFRAFAKTLRRWTSCVRLDVSIFGLHRHCSFTSSFTGLLSHPPREPRTSTLSSLASITSRDAFWDTSS